MAQRAIAQSPYLARALAREARAAGALQADCVRHLRPGLTYSLLALAPLGLGVGRVLANNLATEVTSPQTMRPSCLGASHAGRAAR